MRIVELISAKCKLVVILIIKKFHTHTRLKLVLVLL